ncbi:DUF2971 domain-containing protein [Bradyrhizobium erythrophlei]|uniref:DUF2971 domain-containing protein n=1 Tax=Bradyrhizobium erythrophlei TaxID=1437360 RepID=UPI0035EBED71
MRKSKHSRRELLPPVELPQTLEGAIKDYEDWSNRYFRNVESRSKIAEPLFHYTDLRGFEGILKSGQIWFTDYRHLNDETELMHGIGLAKAMLARRAKKGGFHAFLFLWIDDLLTKRNFGRALAFFIASFSKNRDDLHQWRAYADDGRGVAIGFSSKLFQPNEKKHGDPRRNTFAGPVRYVDAQTRARHAKGFNKASSILDAALRYARRHLRYKEIGMEFLNQLARSVIASPLIWNALTCKHHGYKHEAEVRLVILGQVSKFRGKLSKRQRNGKKVPYIPYDVPLQDSGTIAEIAIGPAAPNGTEAKIRRILKSARVSYPVRIRRSRIPYRSFKVP